MQRFCCEVFRWERIVEELEQQEEAHWIQCAVSLWLLVRSFAEHCESTGFSIYPLVNQHSHGKSQFLLAKLTINGHFQPFSIANCESLPGRDHRSSNLIEVDPGDLGWSPFGQMQVEHRRQSLEKHPEFIWKNGAPGGRFLLMFSCG